ncbi:MAG: thioredoxin family protein [Chloroflexi bacterium]|nr:thioredoxin family protein [Chloroflexota bacterium]
MVTTSTIMDAEQFAQGLTWEQYAASLQSNKDAFIRNYETFKVSEEDAAFFRAFNQRKGGQVKMVIIGEDWCPDVVRGLPIAVRVAEAGGMDVRIFPRDQHQDLMAHYLWRHEYASIPVVIFYTQDGKELGHWIERPAIGYKQMAELTDALASLTEEQRREETRKRRAEWQELWKQETVRELRELLYRVM